MKRNIIELLEERGFIDAISSDELRKAVDKPIRLYCGFDPTADSLHLGNMVGIMALAWFQRLGHTPVAVVGGATGMIGDPGGKSSERPLLSPEQIEKNLLGIRKDLEAILHQGPMPPVFENNYRWLSRFSFLDFLRDVGKSFRVGPMLAKDSVKKRLESEEGMSFTEFSYQLLQAYDFMHLYQERGVTLQVGGSDQWGNITAGIELVRKVLGESVYGLTFPLLLKSDGQKFGKSEKGAIWLSPEKISPYEFYQHLFRTADADVINMLRMLTFVEMDEIKALEKSMQAPGYIPNTVQKRLAEEVTRIVHGEEALQSALRATEAAAPGSEARLDAESLELVAKDMPSISLARNEVLQQKVIDLLVKANLLPSKSEARRMLKNGGVYMNNAKVTADDAQVAAEDLIDGRMLLFAVGKKNKMLVRIV